MVSARAQRRSEAKLTASGYTPGSPYPSSGSAAPHKIIEASQSVTWSAAFHGNLFDIPLLDIPLPKKAPQSGERKGFVALVPGSGVIFDWPSRRTASWALEEGRVLGEPPGSSLVNDRDRV